MSDIISKLKGKNSETNADTLCDTCSHPVDYDEESGQWYHLLRDIKDRCTVKKDDGSNCGCDFPIHDSVSSGERIVESINKDLSGSVPKAEDTVEESVKGFSEKDRGIEDVRQDSSKIDRSNEVILNKYKVPDMILTLFDKSNMSVSEGILSLEIVKNFLLNSLEFSREEKKEE